MNDVRQRKEGAVDSRKEIRKPRSVAFSCTPDATNGGAVMGVKNIGDLFQVSHRGGHKGTGAILPPCGVMLTVGKGSRGRKTLVFGLGEKLMQQQRWVTGDRLTIDLDCERSEITLRRVPESVSDVVSWKLTTRNGGKSQDGLIAAATLKLTATPIMLQAFGMDDAEAPYVPEDVVSGDNGTTFAMRKKWTVHNRQA